MSFIPPLPPKPKPRGSDSGPVIMPCVTCGMKPKMVRGTGATCILYMAECRRCQVRGTECKDEWEAAWKWNDQQHELAGKSNAVLQFPGSLSEKTRRELREARERSNWGPGVPSKGDTVTFEAGSLTINEARRAEGLLAAKAGRTITTMRIEGGTVEVRDYPKVDFELLDVFTGINLEPDTLEPPPLHLWRRFNEWMDRPSRKPFLKPLRKHWWQFRRETMASFEKRMFNAA